MIKTVIRWLLGIWGVGLGFRLTLELLYCGSDGYISIPGLWVNILFDFGMLMIFGLVVLIMETQEMCRWVRDRGNK